MIAVRGIDIKQNFKEICDRVFGGEVMIVSRPKNENIVLISEKKYAELEKAQKNAEYIAMIDESLAQAKRGEIVTKSMSELISMEDDYIM